MVRLRSISEKCVFSESTAVRSIVPRLHSYVCKEIVALGNNNRYSTAVIGKQASRALHVRTSWIDEWDELE